MYGVTKLVEQSCGFIICKQGRFTVGWFRNIEVIHDNRLLIHESVLVDERIHPSATTL